MRVEHMHMHTKFNYSKFNNYINQGQLRLRVNGVYFLSEKAIGKNGFPAIHNQLGFYAKLL